jgi:hypothetical protein
MRLLPKLGNLSRYVCKVLKEDTVNRNDDHPGKFNEPCMIAQEFTSDGRGLIFHFSDGSSIVIN